jgi:hypothetical protein
MANNSKDIYDDHNNNNVAVYENDKHSYLLFSTSSAARRNSLPARRNSLPARCNSLPAIIIIIINMLMPAYQ